MLSSKTGAFIVLVSNILASIIVYLLLFRRKEQLSRHIPQTAIYKTSKIEILTEAISSGTKDTIIMCGYIMFFYCVSHIISDGISLIVSAEKIKNELSFLTASMLEITSGINASSGLLGYKRILGVCFCTSLAGISVFGQIKYALSNTGLSLKTLIYSKLLCALLSPVIATVMMLFIPVEMPIITSGKIYKHPSLITHEKPKYTAIFILILCILLVIFNSLDKRHKNHT